MAGPNSDAVALLSGYDAIVGAIVREIDDTTTGDRVTLSVFLIEPGSSSQRILRALRRAAERGASVLVSIDGTIASKLSRLWERTGSLLPELLALARDLHEQVEVVVRRTPDHAKYLIVERAEGRPAAIVSSANLGDRFQPWLDYAVRMRGAEIVGDLQQTLSNETLAPPAEDDAPPRALPTFPLEPEQIRFVVNQPEEDRFEVLPALDALLRCPVFDRYRVAMAYVDTAGADLLKVALARGARIDLVLPRQANVYHRANLRALARLLVSGGSLRAWLSPRMLHAKAILAWEGEHATTAFLGSANLKRNSFRLLAELNVLTTCRAATTALARALDSLIGQSEPVESTPAHSVVLAMIEERFG